MIDTKQVIYQKNGSSEWKEMGPIRTLEQFNSDFWDWVDRYYEDCEQQRCQNWEDAFDVLNTVGSSAIASTFRLLPAVDKEKQKSLASLSVFGKCALYNELGGYEGLFNLAELADYMEDDFKDWESAKDIANECGYTLVAI